MTENDEQIKHMVNRFLGWKLPKPFNPDNRISFDPPAPLNPGTPYENDLWPRGTNLFCADQAEAMVRYIVEGLPALSRAEQAEAALAEERKARQAFREEVSEAVTDFRQYLEGGWCTGPDTFDQFLGGFILPAKPAVDPLVEIVTDLWDFDHRAAAELRAAIERAGGTISFGEGL